MDAVPRLAGEYAMDTEQSDVSASGGGIRGGLPVWPWGMGEPHGGGADGGGDRAGRSRRASGAEEKNGHAGGRAVGHPGRPHDRKRVLHLFCSGGHGVIVAADFVFCARGGDRFLARAGDESGTFRLGRKRHAAYLVGAGTGGVVLEPRIVCGDEVPVLLLFGIGVGADARAGGAGRRVSGGCERDDSRRRAGIDVDDGGVLPAAGAAGFGGRVEIRCWKCGAGACGEERGAGGDVKERKEVNEVKEVKEKSGRVAAFFDLDGTLVALPSLERRLFRTLRYRREIRTKNYFSWLLESLRLMPRGINAILQGNKMYLRGVQILDERGEGDGEVSLWHKDGHQAEGQASAPPRRNPRLPVPTFFAPAIETLAWGAARAMEAELAARGITVMIRVIATRLEERDGKFTGKVLGEAMFGEAKARAAKRLAEEMQLDLGRCYAYGDNLNDRWLIAAVGRPTAVNPSNELGRIAKTSGWPVIQWNEEKHLTQRSQSTQSSQRRMRGLARGLDGETKKQVSCGERKEQLVNPGPMREPALRSPR